MDKYKVINIYGQRIKTLVLRNDRWRLYINDETGWAEEIKIGDNFNIIKDKDYVHAAYIVNSKLYLPSAALLAHDGERSKFFKNIPGIRDGSLDSLRLRIALARAVRANGMKPCVHAEQNLEKFVADANAKVR